MFGMVQTAVNRARRISSLYLKRSHRGPSGPFFMEDRKMESTNIESPATDAPKQKRRRYAAKFTAKNQTIKDRSKEFPTKEDKHAAALDFFERGYSIRAIAKIVGASKSRVGG